MKGGGGEKEKRFVLFLLYLSLFLSFVNLRNNCGLRALVFFFPFFAAFVLVFFVFVLVLFVFVLSFFGFC